MTLAIAQREGYATIGFEDRAIQAWVIESNDGTVQYVAGGTAITNTIYGRSSSGTIYERRAIHQNPPPPPNYKK